MFMVSHFSSLSELTFFFRLVGCFHKVVIISKTLLFEYSVF